MFMDLKVFSDSFCRATASTDELTANLVSWLYFVHVV